MTATDHVGLAMTCSAALPSARHKRDEMADESGGGPVKSVVRDLAVAAVGLIVLAGCSSSPPAATPPQPGTLPRSTADVKVDNMNLGTTDTVDCSTIDSITTITTGNDAAGITAAVSNADMLSAKFVQIHNIGGFTGSYWHDLDGTAQVKMVHSTYTIAGTAQGFYTSNPAATRTGTFLIRVSC